VVSRPNTGYAGLATVQNSIGAVAHGPERDLATFSGLVAAPPQLNKLEKDGLSALAAIGVDMSEIVKGV
jgi:hypothetical protein